MTKLEVPTLRERRGRQCKKGKRELAVSFLVLHLRNRAAPKGSNSVFSSFVHSK